MDYKTDGELYDDCLTAQSKEQVLGIYQRIIDMIDKFGFVTISDVVCLTKKCGIKNWAYAVTHGWNRSDIVNFTMKYDKSKGWQIFLGNPRMLAKTEKSDNGFKKYLVVLSPRTQIPEYGWEAALVRVRLYVYAPDTKEARKTAIQLMENHHLYCKVTYIREMKGE